MDGTIETEPGPGRRIHVALAAVSLVVLVLTAAIDTLAPAGAIELIGVERAEERRLQSERRFRDGTLAASVERRLRMRSRVRRTLAPHWVAALLAHAGVGGPDVIVGPNRWLFLRERARVDEVLAAEAPVITARTVAAIRRRFAAGGARLFALPIPRKAVACADELPPGFDPVPEIDSSVVRAIQAAGVPVIDAAAAWRDLASEDRYLRYDTHWATAAQAAIAARIAERLPRVDAARSSTRVERSLEPQDAGLLRYLGLDPDSAAAAPLDIPMIERVRLAETPTGRPTGVALVGSSFTATFDLHALLCEALGRDVLEVAVAGAAFSDPLVRLAAAAAARNEALPQHVVFEFPMNQALSLAARGRGVSLALAQLFLRVEPGALAELGGERADCDWSAAMLASSGDGVLQVALEIDAETASRWALESSGMRLAWKLPPGSHRLALPVVDGPEGSTGVRLVALDDGARSARTLGRLASDLDLDGATAWSEGREVPVAPLDALVVRWAAADGDVRVTLRGTNADGTTAVMRHTFVGPSVDFAAVSLPLFEGGVLRSVIVEGAERTSALVAAATPR